MDQGLQLHRRGDIHMNLRSTLLLTIALLCAIGLLSCAGNGLDNRNHASPVVPDLTGAAVKPSETSGHFLWDYYSVLVDPEEMKVEMIPMRQVSGHWNVLKWLETGACTNCFKIVSAVPSGTGTLLVQISVRHPFPNPNLTGFDVRGIAMFNGTHAFPGAAITMSDRTLGEGEIVNPDGYTTLYNPTTIGSGPSGMQGYFKGKFGTATVPSATLNAYKRFVSVDPSNTRNAFFSAETIVVQYEVAMPPMPFVFGYAVDANWAPPLIKPVTDPMTDFGPEANCPEPWSVHASASGIGPWGGGAAVTIDVYDWQGKTSHQAPVLECPELFDGTVTATFKMDGTGFTRYEATVTNDKSAPVGDYLCLVSVEDNDNDPVNKPWLDLTAYQVVPISVTVDFNLTEITPPWLNGYSYSYEISGNLLFAASSYCGIQVFDISNPDDPIWMENIDLGQNPAYDLTIVGGYLYCAASNLDIPVIDIDPIADAHVVNTLSLAGATFTVSSNGSMLYAASATYPDGVMHILDATDPVNPVLVTSVPFTDFPREIVYNNGYAYLAARAGGCTIFDVEPPATSSIVNTVTTGDICVGMTIDGTYAYASSGGVGLQIIDISTPETASIIKTIDVLDFANHSEVSGGYAFVGTNGSGSKVVDVDPPAAASIVNTIGTTLFLTTGVINGDRLYAGGPAGMIISNITDPLTAVVNHTINWPGPVTGVAAINGRVIVANSDGGTVLVNTQDPSSAFLYNKYETGYAYKVTIDGNYAYIIGNGYLTIMDITAPASVTIVNSVHYSSPSIGITAVGGYAYIAAGSDGIVIIDVDPPATAFVVNYVSTTYYAEAVSVSGSYAYACINSSPLGAISIINIDPPATALEIGTVPLTDTAYEIDISGNYAFVANETAGIAVLDITNPLSVSLVGSFPLSGTSLQGIDILYNYAFMVDYSYGLIVVDISNPTVPVEAASLPTKGYLKDIAVYEKYAYIGGLAGGLRIIRFW